jgi:hypothetical protein
MLLPALQRLDELSRLEPDWDRYGALPPSAPALDIAESIMRQVVEQFGQLFGERAAPYTVMPTAAGGLQLEWQGPTAELVLTIGVDGALSYLLVEHPNEVRRFSEGTALTHSAALALIKRIIAA